MSGSDRSGPELCLITNRHLSAAPLGIQVEKILAAGASRVILREKDLSDKDLRALAGVMAKIAACCGRRLVINSSFEAAAEARAWGVQLPFEKFLAQPNHRAVGLKVGVSVHSLREALAAESLGADYVLFGHVFSTDCKAGTPGRGLEIIRQLKASLRIPLWVVGGILPSNVRQVVQAGADVLCVMSSLLKSSEPEKLMRDYLEAIS